MLPSWLNIAQSRLYVSMTGTPCAKQISLGRTTATWSLPKACSGTDIASFASGLEQLLSARVQSAQKPKITNAYLSLIVPDEFARYELLPWSPSLMQVDEIRQFAIERFEMMNQSVRNDWAVHADWKRKDAATLAYALPHALIDALHQTVAKHKLILDSVLPASALAHYGRLSWSRKNELVIINSNGKSSALLYLNGELKTHLMEVVRDSAGASVKRLLSRLQVSELTGELKLHRLALLGIDPVELQDIIHNNKPTRIQILNPLQWSGWR